MSTPLQLGLDPFGDVTDAPESTSQTHPRVIREVDDQAILADESGVDFFGIGEHRDDVAVTSPAMVLATIAGRTARIRLGSAVPALRSDDPFARLRTRRHVGRPLARARRGHPHSRFVRRIVPPLRRRPQRLRGL